MIIFFSVQSSKFEISLGAAGLAVVEGVEALVGFLDFFGSVVEGVEGVGGRGDGH